MLLLGTMQHCAVVYCSYGETAWTTSIGGFQSISKGSGKRSENGHVPVAIWEKAHLARLCPPRWGVRHASWAEIDKIRARAAASQQETMAPGPRQGCPRRLRRPTETRAGTVPAKLHDANWAATTFRHQVPELVPTWAWFCSGVGGAAGRELIAAVGGRVVSRYGAVTVWA